MISCHSVGICGFGGPSSAPSIRRVAKNDKFVLCKRVYNVYGIAPPRQNSTSPRWLKHRRGGFSVVACHNITYYAHEQYKHKTRRRCRPKFSHRWQIVFIHASPLDDRHRQLHRITYLDGASFETPGGARRRRGGE